MSAEEILDLLRQQYNWNFKPLEFFGNPALRTFANGKRLTAFPVTTPQLLNMAETCTTPIAWDFVRGQIALAIAGQLTGTQFDRCWHWLRSTNLLDIWLDPDMQSLAFDRASSTLQQVGISPHQLLQDYFDSAD
ncbi:hypothetical protein [Synechococcus sp. PCC 7336]|uniref:hypothetical protein n=1 Tax=Synechococcus sp. PCC 7336 TaxID=195250 RepID=UPI0003483B9D|nr:hypothetical protein [Synechococcus sp. PCC 7336]